MLATGEKGSGTVPPLSHHKPLLLWRRGTVARVHSCPSTVHAAIGVLFDVLLFYVGLYIHSKRKKGQMVLRRSFSLSTWSSSNPFFVCERSFHGCRDLRRRVIRRSITKRTPIAACTVLGQLVRTGATVPLRHSRRGLWCERGGTYSTRPFLAGCGASGTEKGSG